MLFSSVCGNKLLSQPIRCSGAPRRGIFMLFNTLRGGQALYLQSTPTLNCVDILYFESTGSRTARMLWLDFGLFYRLKHPFCFFNTAHLLYLEKQGRIISYNKSQFECAHLLLHSPGLHIMERMSRLNQNGFSSPRSSHINSIVTRSLFGIVLFFLFILLALSKDYNESIKRL